MADREHGEQVILRRKHVEQRTGLSRSTIYKRMKEGTFPPAVNMGRRMVGWRAADIERFIADPARYRAPRVRDSEKQGDGHERE